jgi:hypothetical protein
MTYIWAIRFHFGNNTYWDGLGSVPGSRTDLWSLAAHEFGHFIGLADNLSSKWNVMYKPLEDRVNRLSIDDYVDFTKYYHPTRR